MATATMTRTHTHTRTVTRCDHGDAIQDAHEADAFPHFLVWCRTCGAYKRGRYQVGGEGAGIAGIEWESEWRLPANEDHTGD